MEHKAALVIQDSVESVEITAPKFTPKTVSEFLLACIEQVDAADHKTNKAQHYEQAFLKLVLANHDKPRLILLFLRRRDQFLSDTIIADVKTAIYFLRHNAKYGVLDPHDRERALLAHKKAEDDQHRQTVTAVIQPVRTGRRGRSRRGRGNGRGSYQRGPSYYDDVQPQHRPDYAYDQGGHGGHYGGHGRNAPQPFSPARTRQGHANHQWHYGHG